MCDVHGRHSSRTAFHYVVIGENQTFLGEEELLRSRGVPVEVVQDERCIRMMRQFIADHPELWNEDIGPGGYCWSGSISAWNVIVSPGTTLTSNATGSKRGGTIGLGRLPVHVLERIVEVIDNAHVVAVGEDLTVLRSILDSHTAIGSARDWRNVSRRRRRVHVRTVGWITVVQTAVGEVKAEPRAIGVVVQAGKAQLSRLSVECSVVQRNAGQRSAAHRREERRVRRRLAVREPRVDDLGCCGRDLADRDRQTIG